MATVEVEFQASVDGFVAAMHKAGAAIGRFWWSTRTEQERAHWLEIAGSDRPADAIEAWMRAASQESDGRG